MKCSVDSSHGANLQITETIMSTKLQHECEPSFSDDNVTEQMDTSYYSDSLHLSDRGYNPLSGSGRISGAAENR